MLYYKLCRFSEIIFLQDMQQWLAIKLKKLSSIMQIATAIVECVIILTTWESSTYSWLSDELVKKCKSDWASQISAYKCYKQKWDECWYCNHGQWFNNCRKSKNGMKVPCKNAENAMKRFVALLKQFSNVVLVVHKDWLHCHHPRNA